MSQSTKIFGALILAFLIFIIARGELPRYLQVILGNPSGVTGSTGNPVGASIGSYAASLIGAHTGGSYVLPELPTLPPVPGLP